MKKESLILLDTNICIYRTLAFVEPKIYAREDLDKVKNKIDNLTNNNFKCKCIISNLVISELKSDNILYWEVNKFCVTKLHMKPYEGLKMLQQVKKSMEKFILKYSIDSDLFEKIKGYDSNSRAIEQFYLKFPYKLYKLTQMKISGLNPKQKQIKINQRPQNLPEEADRKLLGQAIEIDKIHNSEVYIFSNDRDFTEFVEEIPIHFNIGILRINDEIYLP